MRAAAIFGLAFAAVWAAALVLSVHAAEAPAPRPRPELGDGSPGRGPAGTVRARPRTDYDPIGLPLGAFRVYPSLGAAARYDSNILRESASGESDAVAVASPGVRAESDWARHRLALTASADLGIYARHSSENYADARAEATGYIDIRRGLRLEATAGFGHGHEERGSVDGDGGTEPVTFWRWNARAALAGERGAFGYRVGADYVRLNYNDVAAIGGGTLNQDDRDRQILGGFARLDYHAFPAGGVFVAGRYDRTDFRTRVDDGGVNRDARSQTLVAGVSLDAGGITFGQVYAGWFGEQPDDARLEDVSGFTAGGELSANVTPLTTVGLRGDRGVRSTVTDGASSLVVTEVRATVDHELL
ncbi:MAG: outer membrane beta-barrel protein, partial [Alphaproteobacteria bacterium]|nr:outer membrane beta-barrel protein [Alphaproteobacteria bacterium]